MKKNKKLNSCVVCKEKQGFVVCFSFLEKTKNRGKVEWDLYFCPKHRDLALQLLLYDNGPRRVESLISIMQMTFNSEKG